MAYNMGQDEKDEKSAWTVDNGLIPLAALVTIDLVQMKAEIFLRTWPDRFKYFQRPKTVPPSGHGGLKSRSTFA